MPVILICGVSGSGKSWVCRQLADKFNYIPRDEHFKDHLRVVFHAARTGTKPVLTEVPFGERPLREKLESHAIKVIPVFVVEHPDTCAKRYKEREGVEIQKAAYTRAATIHSRAIEWNAFYGTSDEVLRHMKGLNL